MGWLNIYMPRFPVQFIKQYNHIFIREERRPLLWEFKKSLGENKEEYRRELSRELNISYDTWFENMLHDTSERPSFLL